MEFVVGEIIVMRKQHPCGSREWRILRVGADFRLRCVLCGRQVMLPRKQVERGCTARRAAADGDAAVR